VIIPLTNPDGMAYDQNSDTCWRKNRNTDARSTSSYRFSKDIGVDLNRNFDFV
jgi:murein tripeptide amidase MpaA